MEIVLQSKDLKEAIAKVASVINPSSIMPIFRNVYFDMSGDGVRVVGTDTETTVETDLTVTSKEGSESFSVDAATLLNLLKTLPNEALHVSDEEGTFVLRATTGVFKLPLDKGSYVVPETSSTEGGFQLKGYALDMIVKATIQSVSTDDLRPTMGGVCFDLKEDGAVFVATNGQKLAKYQTKITGNGEKLIVPVKVLEQVTGLQDQDVKISYNNINIVFDWGTTKVSGRLVDGTYPPYEKIIPENTNVVSLKQKDLVDALKRASIFANNETKQVVLNVEGNRIVVASCDNGYNKSSDQEVAIEGDFTLAIGFKASILIDILKVVGEGDLKLHFNELASKPVLIKNVASPGLTGLVAPMHIT